MFTNWYMTCLSLNVLLPPLPGASTVSPNPSGSFKIHGSNSGGVVSKSLLHPDLESLSVGLVASIALSNGSSDAATSSPDLQAVNSSHTFAELLMQQFPAMGNPEAIPAVLPKPFPVSLASPTATPVVESNEPNTQVQNVSADEAYGEMGTLGLFRTTSPDLLTSWKTPTLELADTPDQQIVKMPPKPNANRSEKAQQRETSSANSVPGIVASLPITFGKSQINPSLSKMVTEFSPDITLSMPASVSGAPDMTMNAPSRLGSIPSPAVSSTVTNSPFPIRSINTELESLSFPDASSPETMIFQAYLRPPDALAKSDLSTNPKPLPPEVPQNTLSTVRDTTQSSPLPSMQPFSEQTVAAPKNVTPNGVLAAPISLLSEHNSDSRFSADSKDQSESSRKEWTSELAMRNEATTTFNSHDAITVQPAHSGTTFSSPRLPEPSSSAASQPMEMKESVPEIPARTELMVKVQGQSGETINVRLAERGSQIQVTVRSSDPTMAATLRHELPSLTSNLEHAGWRVESSQIATPEIHSHGSDNSSADHSQDQHQNSTWQEQSDRRRSHPNNQWFEEFEREQ